MNIFSKLRRKKSAPAASGAQDSLPKKKILVVDDDAIIIKTMTLKLEANGYKVLSAQDGAAAVSLIRHERPDLVVLDLNFPPDVGVSWDGFRIMEWCLGRGPVRNIPVVVVTGDGSEKNRKHAAAAGAVSFYAKPIAMEDFLKDIKEILAAEEAAKKA